MDVSALRRPDIYRINTVIDCAPGGAGTLAEFYSKLLGWDYSHPAGGGWAAITAPEGTVYAFQEVDEYAPPVWPWEADKPGQMLHLDFWVAAEDLEPMIAWAESLGARLTPVQYFHSSRTMLDPAGHPFCIDTDAPEPEAAPDENA
ncbi:VOC family protein [Ruminococcaceae bacterium OttesenSCG-928-D13]|nr:VOC family protein [Ruminococcaceae bacterium OttesenSCG-928-D13]